MNIIGLGALAPLAEAVVAASGFTLQRAEARTHKLSPDAAAKTGEANAGAGAAHEGDVKGRTGRDVGKQGRDRELALGFISNADLAKKDDFPRPALDRRLRRWRGNNIRSGDWIENSEPRKGEARFLHLESAAKHVLDALLCVRGKDCATRNRREALSDSQLPAILVEGRFCAK